MQRRQAIHSQALSRLTASFVAPALEQTFLAENWRSYARSLRVPLCLFSLALLLSGCIYLFFHGLPAASLHFLFSGGLFLVIGGLALSQWAHHSPHHPRYFFAVLGSFQTGILLLWFAIYYQVALHQQTDSVNELLLTNLFIMYPILISRIIYADISSSFCNCTLALALYLLAIGLNDTIDNPHRALAVLIYLCVFFESNRTQRNRQKEERLHFTYRKQQQAALALAEKESREKSRFIAATSHDLRQPLSSLSLYLDLLHNQLSNESQHELLEKAQLSMNNLTELLTALLDISQLDANTLVVRKQHIQIDETLKKLHAIYSAQAQKKGLTLRLHNPERTVYSDPIMLERALQNLLNNAIKHCTQGEILLASRRRGDKVWLQVWDQGEGIPAQEQDQIFNEFHQLNNPERQRNKGLGLGLAIVKKIVHSLNGELTLHSQPGKGSVFSIAVKAGQIDRIPIPSTPPNLHQQPLHGKTVLIVDDEQAIIDALSRLLASWGAQVISASTFSSALVHIWSGTKPDLVISDFRLPQHRTGTEVINNIHRHLNRHIPAILITGDTSPERVQLAKQSGYLLLHKPVRAAQLRLALTRVMSEATQAINPSSNARETASVREET